MIVIIVAAAVAAAGYWTLQRNISTNEKSSAEISDNEKKDPVDPSDKLGQKHFVSKEIGIEFSYDEKYRTPSTLKLDSSKGEAYSISLSDKFAGLIYTEDWVPSLGDKVYTEDFVQQYYNVTDFCKIDPSSTIHIFYKQTDKSCVLAYDYIYTVEKDDVFGDSQPEGSKDKVSVITYQRKIQINGKDFRIKMNGTQFGEGDQGFTESIVKEQHQSFADDMMLLDETLKTL